MRPLESLIIYLSMYVVFHECAYAPLTYVATILLFLTTLAHLVLEQPRWQFTIVYIQVTHLLYSILIDSSSKWPAGWFFILFSESLLLFSSAIACLFPVAKFPELTGPYKSVGIVHRFLRTDIKEYAAMENTPGKAMRFLDVDIAEQYKEIGVHIYYPASLKASNKEGAQFITKNVAMALAAYVKIPAFLFVPLTLGRIKAIPELELDDDLKREGKKFPWIMLSHGLGGVATMYSCMASELASQGYIVVLPTHNDGSSCLVELSNNVMIPYHRVPVPDYTPPEDAWRASQARQREEELQYLISAVIASESVENPSTKSWPIAPSSASAPPLPFSGHFDLSRLAVVGHSFGGASVVLAASQDPRVSAIVVHDLWMLPVYMQTTRPQIKQPILITQSDQWVEWMKNNDEIHKISKELPRVSLVGVAGTRHSNFSDVPMFSQFMSKKLRAIGPGDFREKMAIVNRVQCAYLNELLQGKQNAFQTQLQKEKEVKNLLKDEKK